MADSSKLVMVSGPILAKSVPLLCRLGFHRRTENNKISRAIMLMEFNHPVGCTRCGALFDDNETKGL